MHSLKSGHRAVYLHAGLLGSVSKTRRAVMKSAAGELAPSLGVQAPSHPGATSKTASMADGVDKAWGLLLSLS